jgi:putative aldouronate transport system permease protein
LNNSGAFIPIYIFLTIWKTVGFASIIYLANIAGISPELYEAARVDSANRFQRVRHITIPSLVPTMMILLILQLGQMFGSNFELVYGLQEAGTSFDDYEVISTWVYRNTIGGEGGGGARFGFATAFGLMQGIIALILTMGANFISKKVSSVSLW